MIDRPFTPARNAEPAAWLVERLIDFAFNVVSVIPSGFEAYARVFHPASKMVYISEMSTSETPLRWSEVADLTGRTAHRLMQWASIRDTSSKLNDDAIPGIGDAWIEGPEGGSLPVEVAQSLWPILGKHIGRPDECFFAVWEGFGGLPKFIHDAPAFEIPSRRFYLFRAPIQTIEQSFYTGAGPDDMGSGFGMVVLEGYSPSAEEVEQALAARFAEGPVVQQSANLWWPADKAWCVATEIDFNTTYVAGSQVLVDAILESDTLEAYQVEPTDMITYDSDTLNPLPDDPYGDSFKIK